MFNTVGNNTRLLPAKLAIQDDVILCNLHLL